MVTMQNSARAGSCRMVDKRRIWRWKSRRRSAAPPFASASAEACRGGVRAAGPPNMDRTASAAPPSTAEAPFRRSRRRRSRVMKVSRKSGNLSRRRVWPVGAVSMMMRSKGSPSAPCSSKDTTLASATSSSSPGGSVSRTSAKSERPSCPASWLSMSPPPPAPPRSASAALASEPRARTASWKARAASSGSTSSAKSLRWLASSTATGSCLPARSTSSTSPRECAGSVDTTRVRRPESAHRRASAADDDVFPTPPLPPTTTKRQLPALPPARRSASPACTGVSTLAHESSPKARSPRKRSG
mmetsp:Transcript_1582/g.4451  ORF Transcript_1582/g.4451 Transcript_1582/m.4451 type:complete len:301 (+) Transcript_1582:583-1485(+)